jgi:hypothetical protein
MAVAAGASIETVYMPCRYGRRHFDMFVASAALLAVVFCTITQWRQAVLDRRAYAKVQAQLGIGDGVLG